MHRNACPEKYRFPATNKIASHTSHVVLSHFCCLLYIVFLLGSLIKGLEVTTSDFNTYTVPGADLEIFERGGPIDYPMGIYQNLGHTKIVAN